MIVLSKKIKSIVFFLYSILIFSTSAQNNVLVFEIKSEIDPSVSRQVKLALEQSLQLKCKMVYIEMNTYGGLVTDADIITKLLLEHPIPVTVFINNNAASAGALISISCDKIFMTEGAKIGAATVVNSTDGLAAPDKYQAYMRARMRAAAQANKRNPYIAEGMVDENVELDLPIKKAIQVITLTVDEAIKYGYCDGKASSLKEVIKATANQNATLIVYQQSLIEKIISFLINPFVSALLLIGIFGGIILEIQHPGIGIGIAIVISIFCMILYFVPYHIHGLIENWEIVVLLIGLILLALEVFVLPGFGIFGIVGLILVVSSFVLMMIRNHNLDFETIDMDDLILRIVVVLISVIGSLVGFFATTSMLFTSKQFEKISLTKVLSKDITSLQYIKIGDIGESVTVLRPSGKVIINNQYFQAISDSDMISIGDSIIVTSTNGNYLKVKKHEKIN